MRAYKSIRWSVTSGVIQRITVEYEKTFWQWICSQPATEKEWFRRDGKDWYVKLAEDASASIDEMDFDQVTELLQALDHVSTTRQHHLTNNNKNVKCHF
jgi:hypothetical protein